MLFGCILVSHIIDQDMSPIGHHPKINMLGFPMFLEPSFVDICFLNESRVISRSFILRVYISSEVFSHISTQPPFFTFFRLS